MIRESRKWILPYYYIALPFILLGVAILMYSVMDTAKDRVNYLKHFEFPFMSSRMEPGFQYYTSFLKWIGASPEFGIVFTCLVIYFLLAKCWFYLVRLKWLESLLLFNFFMFSVFNYYLGTSIRMGLSISLAMFGSCIVLRGNNKGFIFLLLSTIFHYGGIFFAVSFFWYKFTQNRTKGFHYIVVFCGTVAMFFLFDIILPTLGLGDYYLSYFDGGVDGTERLVPFSLAFYALVLFLLFIGRVNNDEFKLSLYGLPFLVYSLVSGITVFGKMIMPLVFLSYVSLIKVFYLGTKGGVPSLARLYVLISVNFLALVYAMKMYRLF